MKTLSALMGGMAITLFFSLSSVAMAQTQQPDPNQTQTPVMGPGMGGMGGMGPGGGGMGGRGGMGGMGPGMMGQGGMGGMGPGMAGGGRGGMGRNFNFDNTNTRGWTMMTPEEQTAHRQGMMSAKSYDECREIQAQHYSAMAERAQAQGKTLAAPRQNACERMQARGFFK